MKRIGLAAFFITLASPVTAQWEVSLLAGWTAPTFEEQFVFNPDIDLPDLPGGSIRQSGEFLLEGRGSFALGGSLAYMFSDHVGIEGRVDTINFKIDTLGPLFTSDMGAATAILDVGMGSINVDRLFPLSANFKARTGGRTCFVVSGGVSYIPGQAFADLEAVSVGLVPVHVLHRAVASLEKGGILLYYHCILFLSDFVSVDEKGFDWDFLFINHHCSGGNPHHPGPLRGSRNRDGNFQWI